MVKIRSELMGKPVSVGGRKAGVTESAECEVSFIPR